MNLPEELKALYPFTPYVHVTGNGACMSYLDEGPRTEEAVLMLHGNPTWSFYYRNVVKALSGRIRCVVPDHIGMGLSDKPRDYAYTLAQRIDDVESLVASLGLTKIHLIVHDWGGAIGMGVATRNPSRIGRIVFLNTAAWLSDDLPGRIAVCRAPAVGQLIVRGFNGFAWPATWMSLHHRKLDALERRGYLVPYSSWANRVAVYHFVKDIPLEAGHPAREVLAEIENALPRLHDRPKLIVWGGRDFCFHDGFLERWKKEYPEAAVHRFPDAGHYVLEDTDGEAIRLIETFFKDVSASS